MFFFRVDQKKKEDEKPAVVEEVKGEQSRELIFAIAIIRSGIGSPWTSS